MRHIPSYMWETSKRPACPSVWGGPCVCGFCAVRFILLCDLRRWCVLLVFPMCVDLPVSLCAIFAFALVAGCACKSEWKIVYIWGFPLYMPPTNTGARCYSFHFHFLFLPRASQYPQCSQRWVSGSIQNQTRQTAWKETPNMKPGKIENKRRQYQRVGAIIVNRPNKIITCTDNQSEIVAMKHKKT